MIRISKEHVIHAHSPLDTPAAAVDPGSVVEFETYDCFQGQMLPEEATYATYDRSLANPATGPLYVNGAEPGDTLKITIRKVEVGPVGILDAGGTRSGALSGCLSRNYLRRLPVHDGYIWYRDQIRIPVRPMIGVIGTAPAGEPVSTVVPMDHGGNMDCTKIAEGAILYLPVFVPGGLLALGDLHAVMGEGEIGNCGVEISGNVTVQVDLQKQTCRPWPLLEDGTHWASIAYGETLDIASEKAVRQMYEYLHRECGLGEADAGMLMEMAGDLITCQIVNPYKTVRFQVDREILGMFLAGKKQPYKQGLR